MNNRSYLQIPGPTNIPQVILDELSNQAINHRGEEFKNILEFNIAKLKMVFQTENDILIYPSSGSGALEASIVNTLSRGDKVLAVNMGVFSQRYGEIAKRYGAEVEWIDVSWGEALDPIDLKEKLDQDYNHEIKAILLTHNETSTAVTNNIKHLMKSIQEANHPALVVLDAVSSLAINDIKTDKWGIDIVVTGSQKGLMLPGGLGILSVSERAWEAHQEAKMSKWYWDFTALKNRIEIGQMPYTPVISHFFALKKSLEIIEEEGLQNIINRHKLNANAFRSAIQSIGLKLLVKEKKYQSNAVTAILLPKDVRYEHLAKVLEDDYNVVIGGGLRHLSGKIFRVGHLGMLHSPEVIAIVNAIEMSLYKLGYDVKLGTAASSASKIYLSN